MFCSNCGKVVSDYATWCPYCAKHLVAKPSPSPNPEPNARHPYHTLGGWLAFFAYAWAATVVLSVVSCIISIGWVASVGGTLRSQMGIVGGTIYPIIVLLYVIILALCGYVCFFYGKLFYMILKKNINFFKWYEIMTLVEAVYLIVTYCLTMNAVGTFADMLPGRSMAGGILKGSMFSGVFIGSLIFVVRKGIVFLYFINSVRVRTYFGTDAYTKKSLFFKRVRLPDPAVPDRGSGVRV